MFFNFCIHCPTEIQLVTKFLAPLCTVIHYDGTYSKQKLVFKFILHLFFSNYVTFYKDLTLPVTTHISMTQHELN